MRTGTNGQRILLSITRPLALSGKGVTVTNERQSLFTPCLQGEGLKFQDTHGAQTWTLL